MIPTPLKKTVFLTNCSEEARRSGKSIWFAVTGLLVALSSLVCLRPRRRLPARGRERRQQAKWRSRRMATNHDWQPVSVTSIRPFARLSAHNTHRGQAVGLRGGACLLRGIHHSLDGRNKAAHLGDDVQVMEGR